MCDHSAEMPGGDSGPEGEEDPVLSSTTGDVREGNMSSDQRDRGVEESRSSGGEVGQEDEDMTSGSHDLSSSAHHSPSSALGSTSSSAKR